MPVPLAPLALTAPMRFAAEPTVTAPRPVLATAMPLAPVLVTGPEARTVIAPAPALLAWMPKEAAVIGPLAVMVIGPSTVLAPTPRPAPAVTPAVVIVTPAPTPEV
jgi:hypothetical protein